MAQAEAGTVSGEQAPVDLEEKVARDVMKKKELFHGK